MCNVGALITNGLNRLGDLSDEPDELFSTQYVGQDPWYFHLIHLLVGKGMNSEFSRTSYEWYQDWKSGSSRVTKKTPSE